MHIDGFDCTCILDADLQCYHFDRRAMHMVYVGSSKKLAFFKTTQGHFWEECICFRGFRFGGFPNPRKVKFRGREVFFGGGGLGKSTPEVQRSAGVSEWLKVGSFSGFSGRFRGRFGRFGVTLGSFPARLGVALGSL